MIQFILHRPFFIKLLHWEYWSFNTIYIPIGFIWVGLCVRARSFFFFSAANPSILNGGFLMESKKAIYDIMPAPLYPKTIYVKAGTAHSAILEKLALKQFIYPLIAKPDVGGRGRGVKKITDQQSLLAYAVNSKLDFLVQEFVPFKNEVGIFYYRYPGEAHGHLSGIVRKEFLAVTGDGTATIRELCAREMRYLLQIPELDKQLGSDMEMILPAGVHRELVPYGNHVRGAKFLDDSALIDQRLTTMIDQVCKQVENFYYGRLDIRYNTLEELKEGKNFSVIEVNGAGSEPTHMYDPRHSLFFAWKEIIRHWVILWRISRLNHKNGIPYMKHSEGVDMFRENKKHEKRMEEQHV